MKALVIGGGVVGLNIALALQDSCSEVILLERQRQSTAASYGNAGHIATEQVDPLASWDTIKSAPKRWFMRGGALSLPPRAIGAWLPFSLRLMAAAGPKRFAAGKAALSGLISAAMPAWEKRLAGVGAGNLLKRDGHYVVWETPETARAGLAAWQKADTGTARFRVAAPADLTQLKALTQKPIHGAIRFENTGQISDTRRLLETLAETFRHRGGRILPETVERLIRKETGVWAALSGGERLTADRVIVSAGIASKPLLETIGQSVPMIAERGYHIQTPAPEWPADMPPVVFEDRSLIVTRFESGLRAASFVEFARVSDPADPRKWARLKGHVAQLGLPFSGEVAEWTGARPTLPDYLPAIGHLDGNLYYAFGHQHLGLTLAAVTGDIVAAMVNGGEIPSAFDIRRFR